MLEALQKELSYRETHPGPVDPSVQETLAMARNLTPEALDVLKKALRNNPSFDSRIINSVVTNSAQINPDSKGAKFLRSRVLH